MSFLLKCEGAISVTNQGYPLCSTGWLSAALPSSLQTADYQVLAYAFASGFGIVVTVASMAFGVRAVLDIIRR